MSKEFLQTEDNRIRWDWTPWAYAVIQSFEVYHMLTVKERHQMKRDNMSGFIYQYLQDNGFVDQSNTRTMSIPEVLKSLDNSQDLLPVIGLSVQCVSLRDLYYVFKKFNIKGRKTGRKIVESVKADTTPVDTDNCTNLESDHSEKSVSTVQVSEVVEEPEQMSPIEQQANDLIFKYMESSYDFWHCCYWPTRRGSIEHRRIAENLLKRDGIYSPELYKTMIGLFQYITRNDVPAIPPKQTMAA